MTVRAALVLLLLVLSGGCDSGESSESGAPATPPPSGEVQSQTSESGPVKATVSVQPAKPSLGDQVTLTLSVEAAAGVDVELPAFGEALGRFTIVAFEPRESPGPNGSKLASQRYTLQSPMSGRQRIPPLRVEFIDERPDHLPDGGVAEVRELLTEELTVDVASVLADGDPAELRSARGALAPTVHRSLGWWVGGGIAGALALAILLFVARRILRRQQQLSAYDRAIERLAGLVDRGMPEPDEIDAWHVELSSIVRRYLEERYGVRAPELTTEEFLKEVRRSKTLVKRQRQLLSSFLEHCDRVKFARYVPGEAETKRALELARDFLENTRLRKEEVARRGALAWLR